MIEENISEWYIMSVSSAVFGCFDKKSYRSFVQFCSSYMSIRGPSGAPLCGTTGPQLCSAAGAKWVLATLPWLELSLFPHQLSADIHSHGGSEWSAATFVKHPVAALMGKQTSLQLFSLVSSLSSPPLNRSSTTPRPLVGGFDSFITEGLGGPPFVFHIIQSVWFPAHFCLLASYL